MCEEQVLENWFLPEGCALLDQPGASQAVTRVRDFVANLARADKGFTDIKNQWKLPTETGA
jgi:hypothetical protein